ncbi:hypothetical protein G7046_g1874 [Stylonectria norvegica]|nr:hypothetical protein G7046_g1874 [Stylonectria norvegica]
MAALAEPKACDSCARAKRKCGKQKPSCARCKERSLACNYSPPKPNCFVLLEEQQPEPASEMVGRSTGKPANLSMPGLGAYVSEDSDLVSASLVLDFSASSTPPHAENSLTPSSSWFLSPDTWKIEHPPPQDAPAFNSSVLKRHVAGIQHWLERWVKTGSNPFIHSSLYYARFPNCLQVAFAVLSSYLSRTEQNAELVTRIVEDRANQLLVDNGIFPENIDQATSSDPAQQLDALEHIARVHSLLVYQYICLFDGDIRLRHLAEGRIHVLQRWVVEMVDCADSCLHLLLSTIDPLNLTKVNSLDPVTKTDNMWNSWILAESIRRTWMVATGLQAAYFTLQQGWSPCPGGMMFTMRVGIWEARTSCQWEQLCSETEICLTKRFEAEKFFTQACPGDIDEFGTMLLEITFGTEKMERWLALSA